MSRHRTLLATFERKEERLPLFAGFTAKPSREIDIPEPAPIAWPESTPREEPAPAVPEREREAEPELVPA